MNQRPEHAGLAPADPLQVSEARVAAATGLRRLGHAIVAHDVDDELLSDIARRVESLLERIEHTPPRQRPIGAMKQAQYRQPPQPGEQMQHFPDCVVSGPANPLGIAIECMRQGDEAVATVTLGAAFEGAPGRAHGGVVAAIFDDTLGYVLTILQLPAYTGRLSVAYRAPTPVGVELEFRARLERRQGRKLFLRGEARHAGTVVAEAEGLFITVDRDRFADG